MKRLKELVYFCFCPAPDETTVFLQQHDEFSPIAVQNTDSMGIQLFPPFQHFGAKETNHFFGWGINKILRAEPAALFPGKPHATLLYPRIVFAVGVPDDFHDDTAASPPL
jgi:hypothetical protein